MNALSSRIVLGTCLVSTGCAHSARNAYFEQTYFPASHNFAFRRSFPAVDGLFNAFDYGHAILYETLWRSPHTSRNALDDRQFRFITTQLLRKPPAVPLDETAIAPEWAKLAPEAVEMFEWAHMLHRQLYDIWADDRISRGEKDSRVMQIVRYYRTRPAVAFSSLPKSMTLMEGQPYSLSFRKRFPTYNGLIWSYHWLQMGLYDALMTGRRLQIVRAMLQQLSINSGACSTRQRRIFPQPCRNRPRSLPASAPDILKLRSSSTTCTPFMMSSPTSLPIFRFRATGSGSKSCSRLHAIATPPPTSRASMSGDQCPWRWGSAKWAACRRFHQAAISRGLTY